MPYIDQSNRVKFDRVLEILPNIQTPGELNYFLTKILHSYVNNYALPNHITYNAINDVVGVLECAKLELYRRVAAPYEDVKIKANGDV